MKRFSIGLVVIGVLVLSGCSTVGKATTQQDEYAKALTPSSDKALVFVLRPSRFGGMRRMSASCNEQLLGSTGAKRFLYALLDPGNYVCVSKAENTSELPLVLEAGKTYYLEQEVKMGLLSARTRLVRLNDAEGREKLAKCTLSSRNNESTAAQ